jgi:hypothetical protein
MIIIKAGVTFINGDSEDKLLCKVNYDKHVIDLYNEAGDRTGIIPLSSVLKLQFEGYYDTDKGELADNQNQIEEGW